MLMVRKMNIILLLFLFCNMYVQMRVYTSTWNSLLILVGRTSKHQAVPRAIIRLIIINLRAVLQPWVSDQCQGTFTHYQTSDFIENAHVFYEF